MASRCVVNVKEKGTKGPIYSIAATTTLDQLKMKIKNQFEIAMERAIVVYQAGEILLSRLPEFTQKELIEFEIGGVDRNIIEILTDDVVLVKTGNVQQYQHGKNVLGNEKETEDIEVDTDIELSEDDDDSVITSSLGLISLSEKAALGDSFSLHLKSVDIPSKRRNELLKTFGIAFEGPYDVSSDLINTEFLILSSAGGVLVRVSAALFDPVYESRLSNLSILSNMLSVVILCHGGHFAGIIGQNGTILAHRTLHRYVVRSKSGGRQSNKDRTSHAQSLGSSMRRYHEVRLREEVQQVLGTWQAWLSSADRIYIHAPGPANSFIFGGEEIEILTRELNANKESLYRLENRRGKEPFKCIDDLRCVIDRKDNRIRSIPFSSNKLKPTLEQALYCYRMFNTAYFSLNK